MWHRQGAGWRGAGGPLRDLRRGGKRRHRQPIYQFVKRRVLQVVVFVDDLLPAPAHHSPGVVLGGQQVIVLIEIDRKPINCGDPG